MRNFLRKKCRTWLYIFWGMLFLSGCGEKQPIYEGFVKDAKTGEPLENAIVYLITDYEKGEATEVKTDSNGYYKKIWN